MITVRSNTFYKITHTVAGIILMYNGIAIAEEKHFLQSGTFFAFGLLCITFAGLYQMIIKSIRKANAMMFAFEAAVFFYLAVYHIDHDKTITGYAIAILAALFFVFVIVIQNKRRKKRSSNRRHDSNNPNPYRGYKMLKDED